MALRDRRRATGIVTEGAEAEWHRQAPLPSHTALVDVQGGAVGEAYHLTASQADALAAGIAVRFEASDALLDDDARTVVVTASGKVVTLPAASTARIGLAWTVVLGAEGYVDVQCTGVDTIIVSPLDTVVRLEQRGASITLRCVSTTQWVIV